MGASNEALYDGR